MTLTNEKIFFSLYSTDNNYFFSTKFSFKVMNNPKLKHLSILLRLLTSSILLFSGIGKQLNPMEFTVSLQNLFGLSDFVSYSTLFLFLRSPGCDICQNELRFWNTGHFNKSVNLVAIFPQLSSEDTEKSLKRFFKRRSLWKHSLYLINNELYKELMGYKNYIGRVFVSNSNEILLCQGDQGSEVERYEFVSKIQNIVSLF